VMARRSFACDVRVASRSNRPERGGPAGRRWHARSWAPGAEYAVGCCHGCAVRPGSVRTAGGGGRFRRRASRWCLDRGSEGQTPTATAAGRDGRGEGRGGGRGADGLWCHGGGRDWHPAEPPAATRAWPVLSAGCAGTEHRGGAVWDRPWRRGRFRSADSFVGATDARRCRSERDSAARAFEAWTAATADPHGEAMTAEALGALTMAAGGESAIPAFCAGLPAASGKPGPQATLSHGADPMILNAEPPWWSRRRTPSPETQRTLLV
jgi:hypothetical protein